MCIGSDMSDQNSRKSSKVFIGGLSWETTGEKLRAYFENYGVVREAFVSYNRNNGRPRGFGFVVFESPDVSDKVVACKHTIDRREVEAKKAVPKDEQLLQGDQQLPYQAQGSNPSGNASSSDGSSKSRKIFVGGLAPSVDDAALRLYFEGFGQVEDAVVMYDHDNKRPRGFGFVTFAAEESVELVFAKGSMQTIQDKPIEIKSAVPRDQMPPAARAPPIHNGYFDPRFAGGQQRGGPNNNGNNFPPPYSNNHKNPSSIPSQFGNMPRGFVNSNGGQRNCVPTVQQQQQQQHGQQQRAATQHYGADRLSGMPPVFQPPGQQQQQHPQGNSNGLHSKGQGMPAGYDLYTGGAESMFGANSQAALAYLHQQAHAHLNGIQASGPGATGQSRKLGASGFGSGSLNLGKALALAGGFGNSFTGGQAGDGVSGYSDLQGDTGADYAGAAAAAAAAAGLSVGGEFSSFRDVRQYASPAPGWTS